MNIKEKVKQQKLKGVLLKLVDNLAIVLLAKQAGMDFLFFDNEHGVISEEKMRDIILFGNEAKLPSIVRIPHLTRKEVSKTLDYGAEGIMVPMVETLQQAKQLVEWSKYPPIGKRSYSGGANTHYAPSGNHRINMDRSNQKTFIIVQIESLKGVENIDTILSLDDIDAAIIGPCDLGISMDNADNVMDEKELQLIQKVADACTKYNKRFGIIGNNELLLHFKKDINILVSAIDTNILRDGLKQAVLAYEQIG